MIRTGPSASLLPFFTIELRRWTFPADVVAEQAKLGSPVPPCPAMAYALVMPRPRRAPRPAWTRLPEARRRAIGAAIESVARRCDVSARLGADPVGLVRAHGRGEDAELVGLVAACMAFGNAKTIRAKVQHIVERVGPVFALAADDADAITSLLKGFRHRVYRGEDVARLIIGARRVQRESGSLGHRFARELDAAGSLRPALAAWTRAIKAAGGLDQAARRSVGARHLVPDPEKTSGCKRLLLYLRWMIRPDDGVDLGIWKDVSPSVLLMPVDTHVHKLSKNLGLTTRNGATWETAEEITGVLATLDARDPVRFDFALCHLGMAQRCPSRRDAVRCEGCGIRDVCRHWARG